MKTITHKTMAFFAVLLAMLLFWAGIGSVMPAVDLTAAAWTSDMTDEEMQQFADDVIALVNQERAAEGIDPVYALPILNETAQAAPPFWMNSASPGMPGAKILPMAIVRRKISWKAG